VKIIREIRMTAIVSAIGLALIAAGATWADESVTVGWFVQHIAMSRQLPADSPERAVRELKASGVELGNLDFTRRLTEADIVFVGRALGVSVTTQNPAAVSDRRQAEAFLVAFGPEIGSDSSAKTRDEGGDPNPASDNGKGKKKEHNKCTNEPL